jgi:ribosomal protein S18 acetylase RimI-like enzyme
MRKLAGRFFVYTRQQATAGKNTAASAVPVRASARFASHRPTVGIQYEPEECVPKDTCPFQLAYNLRGQLPSLRFSKDASMNVAPKIRLATLEDPNDAADILNLLDHYAQHPMGANQPLAEEVRCNVLPGLRENPNTLVFLAEMDDAPVAVAICFVGFSTFKAKPLINIHDLVVHESVRGQGVGSALIDAVLSHASDRQWCAVTLEVRSDNPARHLYAKKGFQDLAVPTHEQTMLFGKVLLPTSASKQS